MNEVISSRNTRSFFHVAHQRSAGSPTAGFTLFETLVATMILAISLVALLELFSGGLRANTISNQYTSAIYHAREKIEEILLSDGLVEGQADGDWEDGYSWHVEIHRQETGDAIVPIPANRKTLFNIDLTISWQSGTRRRQMAVSTFALAKDESDSGK